MLVIEIRNYFHLSAGQVRPKFYLSAQPVLVQFIIYQHYALLTHEFSDLRMGVSHHLCHSDFLHDLAHGSHEPHLLHYHTVEMCFAAVDDSQSDNLVGRCVQKTVGEILGAMTRCVITSIACQDNRALLLI